MSAEADKRIDLARRRAQLRRERDRAIVQSRNAHLHPEFGIAFMRRYLPHYMKDDVTGHAIPPAEWHGEFFQTTFGALGTGQAHAHLAPRGFAKSTIGGVGVSLASLGLQLKNYIWLIQDTQQQAKLQMEAVLSETEDNELIKRDFPHLVPKLGKHNRPVANRDDDVVFASGQRIQALGSGQKVRGRRNRQHRPDLCIADDLENDELVMTKYQRDKLESWFFSAVLPAMAKNADVVYLGTLLHHDALLARIRAKAEKGEGWHFHTYYAMHTWGDFSTSTWPEFWDAARFEEARHRMGLSAFAREYGHQVIDEEQKLFPKKYYRYEQAPSGEGVRTRIAVDPAASEKDINDYSAIAVVSKRRGQPKIWVQDVWMGHVRMKRLVQVIVSLHAQYGGVVIAETVQAQEWLKQELQDYGIPVRGIKPTKDKYTRAEGPAIQYENGLVYHSLHLKDTEFEDLLDQFPHGAHDDPVDAVVYGISELGGESAAGALPLTQHEQPAKLKAVRDPRGAPVLAATDEIYHPGFMWRDELQSIDQGKPIQTTPIAWWDKGLRAAVIEFAFKCRHDGDEVTATIAALEVHRLDTIFSREKSPALAVVAGN